LTGGQPPTTLGAAGIFKVRLAARRTWPSCGFAGRVVWPRVLVLATDTEGRLAGHDRQPAGADRCGRGAMVAVSVPTEAADVAGLRAQCDRDVLLLLGRGRPAVRRATADPEAGRDSAVALDDRDRREAKIKEERNSATSTSCK